MPARLRQLSWVYDSPASLAGDPGARVQRPAVGEHQREEPTYRDVMYVESLVGQTPSTRCPSIHSRARIWGRSRERSDRGFEEAKSALAELRELGIDTIN